MEWHKKRKLWIILFWLSVVLFLFGALLGFVGFPLIVKSQIAKQVALKKGTEAFDRWNVIPIPLQFKAYFFNVTNPDGVQAGEKPVVKEIGPYVFNEHRKRYNLTLDTTSDTATFNQDVSFEFNQEASGDLCDDDKVFVLNLLMVTIAYKVGDGDLSSTLGTAFSSMFKNTEYYSDDGMFMNVAVKDILFGVKIPINCGLVAAAVCVALRSFASPSVIEDEDGKLFFSLFHYKNSTDDGPYTIYTGLDNVTRIGEIISYQGVSKLDLWGGDSCNEIKGTDMTVFRPYLDNIEDLYIFNSDARRVIRLSYEEPSTYKGINARRYTAEKGNFLSSVVNYPDNYCYCPRSSRGLTSTKPEACYLEGLADISPFQIAPVALSYPHFHAADELYRSGVEGMYPNPKDHKITLDLEPHTGTPLKGGSRVQINFPMLPYPKIKALKNVREVMFPVMWFEEGIELNDELVDMLNNQLLIILTVLQVVRWLLVALGLAGSIVSAFCYCMVKKQKRKSKNKNKD